MTDVAEKPNFITSSLDFLVNWGRTNSLWPFPYGTACCAIEFMSTEVGRYDLSRIGSEYVRFTPRQSDVLLVAGTITYKQAPILKRIYEQMAEPRWVIAMGACACSGGFYDCYCTVPGIDHIIPVDVYIGGCPSRPEAFFDAMFDLQKKIKDESYMKQRAGRVRDQLEMIKAKDEKFDTDFHEAVAQVPVGEEDKKGLVFDVVQTGYTLSGKVIRYAKVVVGI